MYPKKITTLIDEVVQNIREIGISRKNAHISNQKPRNNYNNNSISENSFILRIPYAGIYLDWEVSFTDDINFGPDFDFLNDTFLSDPDIDLIEKQVPSLHQWDINEPKALFNVIRELLSIYKKFHVDKLQIEKFSKQLEDYNMLINGKECISDDIEVYIDESDVVHFLIKLPIKKPPLPPCTGDYFNTQEIANPEQDCIFLKISYAIRVKCCLWLSQSLEEVLGDSSALHIPAYKASTSIDEYVEEIRTMVTEKLAKISNSFKMRKEFISATLSCHGGGVIEYDSITFHKITVLMEIGDTHWLLTVSLGKNFPQEKPTLQVQSADPGNEDCSVESIKNFSYSATNSVEVTLRIIFTHLQNCLKLK